MAKKVEKAERKEGERIIPRDMEQMMHDSMMPYAQHVILERALPRVEDGLKPVQRRILYTMMELSLPPDKPHRKCARIVGDCLGKYHPHGDSSVYDAMVRMAQEFNMHATLVDGHGNFGSVDGDPAAAMRYTEARMTPLAMELLRDIEKDTVQFSLNFDDSLKEPDTLPAAFPNLLVNGATGIAVGLATNIPPHNLAETVSGAIALLDNPNLSLDELMRHIPCPDFPTGGYLLQESQVREAYETGRGRLILRAKTHVERLKNGKSLIVVTQMPFQVNKASALEKILQVTQQKKTCFAGVSDIRDESDREGMRAVIELKKDTDPDTILHYLFKYTDLQTTFGVNMVAIAQGVPRQMGLLELVRHYLNYRREVVLRRTRHDLENARRREHILQGLMMAILNLDEVIALIRASKAPKIARDGLMQRFSLTETQAQAILDLRLQRLTNLELLAIRQEHADVVALIAEFSEILASDVKLRQVIRDELLAVKKRHARPRRTQLLAAPQTEESEEPVENEAQPCTVLLLEEGRVRRLPALQGAVAEHILCSLDTMTDQKLRLFTNKGYVLSLTAQEIPEIRGNAKPVSLASLLELQEGEQVVALMDDALLAQGDLFFYTAAGCVKRTPAAQYQVRTKRAGAIALKGDDQVVGVERECGDTLIMVSKQGMSIRFELGTVPAMGRAAGGVKCFKLDEGDSAVFAAQVLDEGELLLVTDRGYAKRSFVFDYDIQGRNGKGQRTFDFKKNGANGLEIAGAAYVREPFEFAVTQFHGTRTVVNTEQVPIQARNGAGRLLVMALLDDVVTAVRNVNPAQAAPAKLDE